MDLAAIDIVSAREQFRAGRLTSLELTAACSRQIERLNPLLNAFITVLHPHPDSVPDGPLAGIPVAVKDLYDTAGVRTTAGTPHFADHIPTEDAVTVKKLKEAGAVLMGKTNTHEIALGVTGANPHYGSVCNPWDTDRISGGSSSGSAVAVATGMCLAALGTDTGGSIRIPASLCGVVGLKPNYGRISLRGVLPLSWNLDHAGPLTRNVKDAAILLQVLAGYDARDPSSAHVALEDVLIGIEAGVRGWRIALAAGRYAEAANGEVQAAVKTAAGVFEQLGAIVEAVDVSFLRKAAQANALMVQADAAAFHRERLVQSPKKFGADVRERLQTGAKFTAGEYSLARRTQAEMRRRMETFFENFDLLLTPTTPVPAPPLEGSDAIEQARRLTWFTAPFNLTGLPALSVPCGFSSAGLPIGLQLISEAWGESKLLRAGRAFEQATDWHKKSATL